MADSILIAVNRDLIRGPSDWNKILATNGLEIAISEDLDSISHSGFIRCLYEGKRAGFEYDLEEIDLKEFDGELKKLVSSNDSVISLTPRDGIKSALAASAIAAAIALTADTSVIDVDETVINGSDAIDWVRSSIESYNDFQVKAAEAKKEAKKLNKSKSLTRDRLEREISLLLGHVPSAGFTAGVYLGLVFERDGKKSSISTRAWEFGNKDGLLKHSDDLLQDTSDSFLGNYFADEEKCEEFYSQLGEVLDDCEIIDASLSLGNEVYIKFSNEIYMRSLPKDELKFSSQLLQFIITPDEIHVDA